MFAHTHKKNTRNRFLLASFGQHEFQRGKRNEGRQTDVERDQTKWQRERFREFQHDHCADKENRRLFVSRNAKCKLSNTNTNIHTFNLNLNV